LQTGCEICQDLNYNLCLFSGSDLFQRTKKLGITNAAVCESLEVLEARGYLKTEPWARAYPEWANRQITVSGFELYLKTHRPDYGRLLKKFASLVVNEGIWEGEAIEEAMGLPGALVRHMVDTFTDKGWLVIQHYGGGRWAIVNTGGVSAELKRWLEAD
jgi:hypothetical protein